MAEYKNIDAILKEIYRRANRSSLGEITVPHLDWKELVSVIKDAPTADVAEVKHGEWKREDNEVCYWYVCSECRDEIPRNKYGGWSFPNYCPNCGAKMDRGDNE